MRKPAWATRPPRSLPLGSFTGTNASPSTAGKAFVRFEVKGANPATVIVIEISEVYTQCARALMRSGLWKDGDQSQGVPSAGDIIDEMTRGEIDGPAYDAEWPERAEKNMW